MIPYPAIRPTELSLVLDKHRIDTYGWQGVWEQPAILGSLPSLQELRLSYTNITIANAVSLLVCWRASGSGFFPLNALPAEVVAGVVNPPLAAWIQQPVGLKWTWAEAPTHTAVKAGRATVVVRLVAELR